jgi:adenine-specific DNA-methyltransferase
MEERALQQVNPAGQVQAGSRPATSAVLSYVQGWWRSRAEQVGLSGEWLDVEYAIDADLPLDLQADSAELGPLSAHELGLAYVETLSAISRSEHGRHYTPAPLAEQLWRQARAALGWNSEDHVLPGLVRDPACGAGALLLPPLREHLRASSDTDPSIVMASLPSHIEGIDMDELAVWLANVVLAAETLPVLARVPSARRRPVPVLARVGDGLDPTLQPASVAIMNPPYGRLKLPDEQRTRFQHVLYGHANLYGLFMAEGARNLTLDGVLAALVPTSFAAGLYFHRLRSFLSDTAPLRSVTFVQDRSGVFSGVIQETCLAVFAKKRSRRTTISRANGHVSEVATIASPRGGEPWLMPREASDAAIAAAAAALPLSLAGAGWHASTGPLVWNRRKSDLFANPGRGRVSVLWGADVESGSVQRHSSRDALRYLKLSGENDGAILVLREPAILVQRTTAPEQIRRLVSADLSPAVLAEFNGQVVVENHLNVLRPNALLTLISRECLARVLSTRTLDRVLRCLSGSVAVSSYELSALPLPDAETLSSWETLYGNDLEVAVANAYRPKSRR